MIILFVSTDWYDPKDTCEHTIQVLVTERKFWGKIFLVRFMRNCFPGEGNYTNEYICGSSSIYLSTDDSICNISRWF